MEIHFLGTGSAQSGGSRQNTSLLLISKQSYILVDCSGTPSYALAKKGITPDKISDIILTHAHVDHLYALPSFIHNLWLYNYPSGGACLRIHANKETLAVAEKLINAFGLKDKPSAVQIELLPIATDPEILKISFNDWLIETFGVDHGGTPTLGLQLTKNSENIVFSADSLVCDSIKSRINNAKLLIQDCCGLKSNTGHAGAQEINTMIRNSNCALVYLSHLPELTPKELQEIMSSVQQGFSGEIAIPEDGTFITI